MCLQHTNVVLRKSGSCSSDGKLVRAAHTIKVFKRNLTTVDVFVRRMPRHFGDTKKMLRHRLILSKNLTPDIKFRKREGSRRTLLESWTDKRPNHSRDRLLQPPQLLSRVHKSQHLSLYGRHPLHRTRHTASHSLSTSSTRSTRRSRLGEIAIQTAPAGPLQGAQKLRTVRALKLQHCMSTTKTAPSSPSKRSSPPASHEGARLSKHTCAHSVLTAYIHRK